MRRALNRRALNRRAQAGVTLMELMVTVAIVAILAAVALPGYQGYVQRAARSDVQAILLETAQFLERVHTTTNSYSAATLPSAVSPKGASGSAVRYTVSLTAQTATAFTLQAVPAGAQTGDTCGTLTLASTGTHTPATGCW